MVVDSVERGLELMLERVSDPARLVTRNELLYEGANATGSGIGSMQDRSVEPERACLYGWCWAIEAVYGLPNDSLYCPITDATRALGFGHMTAALDAGAQVQVVKYALEATINGGVTKQ